MSSQSEIKKRYCQIHKLEIIVVDLKSSTKQEDKYLQAKCLYQKIDNQNFALLTETIDMIQDMKTQALKVNKEENQNRLNNMKQLQVLYQKYQIILSNRQIRLKKKLIHRNLSQKQRIQTKMLKFYQIIIKVILITLYLYNNLVQKTTSSLWILCIKFQIQYRILNNIPRLWVQQNALNRKKNSEESQVNRTSLREFDQHKAPYVYQQCNKHCQKIMMVNVNQDLSRFACVVCVQEFPKQYITLEEANKRWNLQKEQQKDLINQYNLKRKNQYNNSVQIIKKLKDNYQTLNEILISLDKQMQNSSSDIFSTNKFNNKNLFLQDEKKIQQIIKLLISKDYTNHIKEKQEKQDQSDLLFYSNLKTRLENLMKEDLLCKYQINKNLNRYQQIVNQIKDDNKNALNFQLHEFILKSQMQDLYLIVLNESVQSFKELQNIYEALQKNGQLQQIMEIQQEKLQVKNLFQLFEHNYIRMKKLIMAKENEQQLDQVTQQKQQLLIQIKELNDRNNQFFQKIIQLELEINQINVLFNCKLNEKKWNQKNQYQKQELVNQRWKNLKYQFSKTKDLNNQILNLNSNIKKK
ncbi:unnamed protein product [Paramecium sonneborni]|uniref:Transmembrane protein n=1 Tax=Paramecium sonneborni TaxID=65129 RepID=A0A8S1RXU6_9CILI|nr:unnamed protein product [Paramecium sonneborni]